MTKDFGNEYGAQDGLRTVSVSFERELINKLARKFAESPTDDIDMIFDMLITSEQANRNEINKA